MSIARVVLGVLLVCALSGCTEGKQDGRQVDEPLPDLPAVVHPKAAVPKDRDPAAVMAALTRLDACALMGSANGEPMSSHRCRLETAPGERMTLTIGAPLDRADRHDLRVQTIKGARVYVHGPDRERCAANIPVSFTQTIEVELTTRQDVLPSARCQQVWTMAAAVVTRLAKPDAYVSRLPRAHWNACTALARSKGLTAPTSEHEFVSGLDNCTDPNRLWVDLSFGKLSPGRTVRQLGGKPVRQHKHSICDLLWSQGPSGLANAPQRIVTVRAKTCAQADKMALVLMKALDGPPPAQAEPQYPLTSKPSEPDMAAAGACADVGNRSTPCEPYRRVEAPTGAKEVLRRAKADPNVICAVAVEAVGKHLGPGFRPVITDGESVLLYNRSCTFVEHSHELAIAVTIIDAAPLSADAYQPPRKNVTVNGRPGTFSSTGDRKAAARFDELHVEAADGISLRVQFTLLAGRGATRESTADTKRAALLQPLVSDILNKHFT